MTLCRSRLRANLVSNSVNYSLEIQKMFTVIHIYNAPTCPDACARQPKFWPRLHKPHRSMPLSISQANAPGLLVVGFPVSVVISQNHNYRMAWVGKDVKVHSVTTHPPKRASQDSIHPGLEWLQGWGIIPPWMGHNTSTNGSFAPPPLPPRKKISVQHWAEAMSVTDITEAWEQPYWHRKMNAQEQRVQSWSCHTYIRQRFQTHYHDSSGTDRQLQYK